MNKGLLSVDEALETLLSGARPVREVEEIPTLEATHRVLAKAQRSAMDVPPLDNSAMDGYAVRLSDLQENSSLKVGQRLTEAIAVWSTGVGSRPSALTTRLIEQFAEVAS